MASTVAFGSIYPGLPSTQSGTNPPKGTARTPSAAPSGGKGASWGHVPVLPGVASGLGISVPMLVALGVLSWYMFRQYR